MTHFTFDLREWAMALTALILSVVGASALRRFLTRLIRRRKWDHLEEVLPFLAYFLYIVGLRIFGQLAPLNPRVETWFEDVIYIIGVYLILTILRRTALLFIEWGMMRSQNSGPLQQGFIPVLRNVITLFIFLTGGIMVLKHFSYDVMSLVTALGVSSLAVGLAAKDTLSNMISGFTLMIDGNVRPGDRINLNGIFGMVSEIGLRSTRIRTDDGNTLIVPNADLVNTKIINLSMPSREASCSTLVRVPYSVPYPLVRSICQKTLEQLTHTSKTRGNWISLNSLSEGHQLISVGIWVADFAQQGDALTELNEKLLQNFTQNTISLLPPPTAGR